MTKIGPKLAFLFILGQALPVHLVGGCGARAVSRNTPIYFIKSLFDSTTLSYHLDTHYKLVQEEEEVVGFEGRKKSKEQRHKNKAEKKKEKKKNKKDKKKKKNKNKDKEVEEKDEDDYDYDDDDYDIFDDDEDDDYTEDDDEDTVEEVEDCEVFKCNAVTNGYTAYKLYRSINDIRQKLDL